MYGPMSFKILGEYMGVYNTRFWVQGEQGWYLISGLGHKISCQTRNTIESLLKVKVARTRT